MRLVAARLRYLKHDANACTHAKAKQRRWCFERLLDSYIPSVALACIVEWRFHFCLTMKRVIVKRA